MDDTNDSIKDNIKDNTKDNINDDTKDCTESNDGFISTENNKQEDTSEHNIDAQQEHKANEIVQEFAGFLEKYEKNVMQIAITARGERGIGALYLDINAGKDGRMETIYFPIDQFPEGLDTLKHNILNNPAIDTTVYILMVSGEKSIVLQRNLTDK